MNVYRIYLFIDLSLPLHWFFVSDKKGEKNLFDLVFTSTPLLMIDKKGEKYLRKYLRYMHDFLN